MQNGEVFLKEHCGKRVFAPTCEPAEYSHFMANMPLKPTKLGVIFGLKFHLMADFKGLSSTCLLVEFPLPKVAVLFLIVDYDR
jgi:hypothetical protein